MEFPFIFMRAYLNCVLLAAPLLVHAAEPLKLQRAPMASPPLPQGDERGLANQLGAATWNRCAWHMTLSGAKAYELSQIRSNTMPLSPFAGPYAVKAKPTAGIPMTAHAYNSETMNEGAEPGQQGTQFDALGHFGALKQPWRRRRLRAHRLGRALGRPGYREDLLRRGAGARV